MSSVCEFDQKETAGEDHCIPDSCGHQCRLVHVDIYSTAGAFLCDLEIPCDSTVMQIKAQLSTELSTLVGSCDMLCLGSEVLLDVSAPPLQEILEEEVVMTLCFSQDFSRGDLVHYTGPSIPECDLQRGACYRLNSTPNKTGQASIGSVDGAQATQTVSVAHLCRCPPDEQTLPGGYKVGDTVYYIGPKLVLGATSRPVSGKPQARAGGNTAWTLSHGASGTVMEAGVIESSLRIRFHESCAPSLLACSLSNLSPEVPPDIEWSRESSSRSIFDLATRRCWTRLARMLDAADAIVGGGDAGFNYENRFRFLERP